MQGHRVHGRTWIAVLVVLALIAAHVALLGLAFRGHLSLAVVAGAVGVLVMKYGWWRFRRYRSRDEGALPRHHRTERKR